MLRKDQKEAAENECPGLPQSWRVVVSRESVGEWFQQLCTRSAFWLSRYTFNRVKDYSDQGIVKCFVFGDFNIRLGEVTGDNHQDSVERCALLLDWTAHPQWALLSPNEGKWTTITANGKGIPDHVICSGSANHCVWNYAVLEHRLIESDHRPLVMTFGLDTSVRKLEFDRWDIKKLKKKENLGKYKETLLSNKEVKNSLSTILADLRNCQVEIISDAEAELVIKNAYEMFSG